MDITTLPSAAELSERRRLQIAQEMLKEHVSLKNNPLASFSTDDLLTELFVRSINEGEAGRAVESSDDADVASDQQLKDVAAAAAKEEKLTKRKSKKSNRSSGGFISMIVAFGSITTLILSLSLIHQSGGLGEGGAPPALPPFGSRSLRHRSNNDNVESPEIIQSPLPTPAPIVAPPPPLIFSPAAASNRRMKFDKLRSATCFDTPNWKDVDGIGCDYYEEYDECAFADMYAGDMGPATENCCVCGGGIVSLPPTNSPYPSNSPTKSATPSSSPTITNSPTMSSSPTEFCLDTPNWKDKWGRGCDLYEENVGKCASADDYAGDMGPATVHCCHCQGGFRTCENYRSTCKDYFDIVGIKDGVMSPFCKEAESCSCGDHDVKIATTTNGWGRKYTVGLYNECKCDFWSRLCEDSEVGEACDYAAEYCCGDYLYTLSSFLYRNSPTCYCDFSNYAQNEFEHALKPKAINISKEFTNSCLQMEYWGASPVNWERASVEAMYNKTDGWNWTKNDGWMNETVDHCQWYGISCNDDRRITHIDLRDNNLAGQFPVYTRNYTYYWGDPALLSEWKYTKYGLANLYKLETIDLAGNKLTGTIDYRPLYNLALLTHFDISGNQLSGGIDALVAPSITHSDLSNNNFTSMRRFDKYRRSYQTLLFYDVSNNTIQINATDRLNNIPINIKQLFAQDNQIYGNFPDSMNDLSKLLQFDMSSNALTGSLPVSLNNLPQLRYFNMSHNSLAGSLPESLDNLPQLRQFDVSSNALSGQLPDFAESFVSLQELDLSNQTIGFTGSIPEDLARFQSLKVLKLDGNKLKGTIPPSIGNIAVLEIFNVSNNLLSSTIPAELGLLDGVLKRLDLLNNNLSGRIPSEIGQLQGASILLEGNLFSNSSEAAPLSLCLLRSVEVFDLANDTTLCPIERNALSDFYDSAKGGEWTDSTNWLDEYTSCCEWKGVACENDRVTKLNLRNNGLSGRLSENIGNLTALEVLDLSDNDIKGSIPTNISLLSNLNYLRLSYNAFTGTAPEGLGQLKKLELLQLQSNRITNISTIPRLNEAKYKNSTFVADCGVPSAFVKAFECANCTMCCNANDDCYPHEETFVKAKMGLESYWTYALVLFAAFVVFSCMVFLCCYLFSLVVVVDEVGRKPDEDDSFALALGRIGKDSVYSYIVTDKPLGWVGAFVTLGIQIFILVFFVNASEANLQDDKIDIEFTWKCPRDSEECRDTADLTKAGWFIFVVLMIAFLAKDIINGFKLIYYSSKVERSSCWSWTRFRYFVGGTSLCSITLFALYVSTVYNSVIATSNTAMIVNSVVVLFVMEIDERIFAALDAISKKFTKHASESEEVTKVKEELEQQKAQIASHEEDIDNQQTQIESQQVELGILRSQQEELMLQRDQAVARQNDEIATLRGIVQQMQDSLVQSIPHSPPNEIVTTHAAEMEDTSTTASSERETERDAARARDFSGSEWSESHNMRLTALQMIRSSGRGD